MSTPAMARKSALIVIALTLAFCVLPRKSLALAFTNGSFEDGAYPGSTFRNVSTPGEFIPGWTLTSGSVDYIGGYWQASDGGRSVDLSGNRAGTISQTFDTLLGASYSVWFDMAGNPDGNPYYNPNVSATKSLTVFAADDVATFDFDLDGSSKSNMGWNTYLFTFTAVDTSTTLSFQSLNNSAYGPALDNVVVQQTGAPVPEPATIVLLGSGLAGMNWFRRRRKK